MKEITQELLRELLDYSPETGVFIWRHRDRRWFKNDHQFCRWNTLYSGRVAGSKRKNHRVTYRCIAIFDYQYFAHRLAWVYVYGKWPENQIDHINGNGLDNSMKNLRDVTSGENSRNARLRADNTTGVAGVSWHKRLNKYQAKININGERVHIGTFDSFEDAVEARCSAQRGYGYHKNHGEVRG